MPRRETRGSQLNSRPFVSPVSRTYISFHCERSPSPGRTDIPSVRRDFTAGTAANGPACAPPCLAREPVAATRSRPRARLANHVRGRRRGHRCPADLRHSRTRSRSTSRAPRLHRSNSSACKAGGWGPHRDHTGGLGSPYLAARKTPPGNGRRIASNRLAQRAKLSLRYALLPAAGVEWVVE